MRSIRPGHRSRWLATGLVVLAALIASSCGNSGDKSSGSDKTTTSAVSSASKSSLTGVPGVTDDQIKFSSFGTITQNPLGTCVLECFDQGVKAYFAYRNSLGGVDGRKMVLTKELDDQLAQNKARALEIVSANDTFASFSAAELSDGWGDIAKAGIPLYVWNINPADAANPTTFGNPQATVCLSCARQANGYIARLEKAKRIGILGYSVSDNSKLAAEGIRDSITQYSDEIGGAKVAYFNEAVPFGVPNGLGPEVSAMKDKGVDLIYGSLDLNAMKTLSQELARQGMGDVHLVNLNLYDQKFVKDAGDLFEGDIVETAFRPFEAATGQSDLALFKDWMDKSGHEPVELAFYGWIAARTAYDGIVAAGPNFDRAKVIEASNKTLNDYTAGGLIPPQDYGRSHTMPTEATLGQFGPKLSCTSLLRVKNGKFVVIGDKNKPFECWPGDTTDWSEPQIMDFK